MNLRSRSSLGRLRTTTRFHCHRFTKKVCMIPAWSHRSMRIPKLSNRSIRWSQKLKLRWSWASYNRWISPTRFSNRWSTATSIWTRLSWTWTRDPALMGKAAFCSLSSAGIKTDQYRRKPLTQSCSTRTSTKYRNLLTMRASRKIRGANNSCRATRLRRVISQELTR